NCKRGVANPATAWHEGDDRWSNRLIAAGFDRPAGTRNNIQNFLRRVLQRYPVGASGADQSLVIARRNFPADENREHAQIYLFGKVDDAIEGLGTEHRKENIVLLVVDRATLADPGDALVELCDLLHIRQPASYTGLQFVQFAGF